jgi:hypothetical protein
MIQETKLRRFRMARVPAPSRTKAKVIDLRLQLVRNTLAAASALFILALLLLIRP